MVRSPLAFATPLLIRTLGFRQEVFSETQSPILSLLGSFRERVCEKRKVVVIEFSGYCTAGAEVPCAA